jgi:CBS domain-containing protein
VTVLVKDIMTHEVAAVGPDASLMLAARRMRDHGVGCLPIVEDERLVGMLTDRDIVVRGVAAGLDPARAVVGEAMSAGGIACSVEDAVDRAQDLMAANRIKQLPVLDRRERLVGLVALSDLTGRSGKCRPHQVTFYKRLANSSGHLHNVEVGKVYLSPAIEKADAVPTALAKFAENRGLASWDQVADLYELEDPA